MNKLQALAFMLDSIKQDNYMMAKQSGMSEEEIKDFFVKSEDGLNLIVFNLYNRMQEQKIIP
jgi:N-acetylglutamate synthase-like GNAT family acetyltransferase